MKDRPSLTGWALVLGASSGFGEANSLELARCGMDIFGVHLDRKATQPNVERIVGEIRAAGRKAFFYNVNAADASNRAEVLADIAKQSAQGPEPPIRLFLHSLAFGTLKPFMAEKAEDGLSQQQLEMTLDVMANSFVYWIQDLFRLRLIGRGSRLLAMTSAGSSRVWTTYGAVSAAKAALESYIRQLAFELGPQGITVNGIRAGVTDTPALRKIPGNEAMIQWASSRNPSGRVTTPQDVASAIAVVCQPGTQWMTGNVIGVDGGEILV